MPSAPSADPSPEFRRTWSAAEALCRQALELAPEDPMGIEMMGDLQAEKGNLQTALELYARTKRTAA